MCSHRGDLKPGVGSRAHLLDEERIPAARPAISAPIAVTEGSAPSSSSSSCLVSTSVRGASRGASEIDPLFGVGPDQATIAPTVRQAIRINSHTAVFEHATASQATVSSKA